MTRLHVRNLNLKYCVDFILYISLDDWLTCQGSTAISVIMIHSFWIVTIVIAMKLIRLLLNFFFWRLLELFHYHHNYNTCWIGHFYTYKCYFVLRQVSIFSVFSFLQTWTVLNFRLFQPSKNISGNIMWKVYLEFKLGIARMRTEEN